MSLKVGRRKIFNFSLLSRVLRFAEPYKRRFIISVILAIILALFSPIRPYLVQLTINDYVRKGVSGTELVRSHMGELIIWITVIQVGLLIVESAFRFYFSFLTAWLGQTVVKDLRVKVYEKILHLNLAQFDKTPIGTLTTRTINDIESINDIFAEGLIPILADLLSIVCILGFMFYVDWRLTLICLAPFPFLIAATWVFKESVNKSFIRVRNAVASLNAF
ncbi:MAG TPA: ABC transporter ATP-binding protein, partial [Flavitalea sp.]|nr:ABC transporter ATP-binding protein [Flavitalea sp.]